MDPITAYTSLGVQPATLSPRERQLLDEDGFVALTALLTARQVADMRARLLDLVARQRTDKVSAPLMTEPSGTQHVGELIEHGAVFDPAWSHPRIVAAAEHILGVGAV